MTNLVEFNDTVMFTCSASGTPLWFSWHNGSSIVTAGGRVELRNGGRELFINGVTRYDEGPFKCLVKNNISHAETNQMNLNISCEYTTAHNDDFTITLKQVPFKGHSEGWAADNN